MGFEQNYRMSYEDYRGEVGGNVVVVCSMDYWDSLL